MGVVGVQGAMADDVAVSPRDEAGPAADAAREAQQRLACLLRWIDALDEELQGIYTTLPAPTTGEADAMEAGEIPETLSHYLRTAIECLRADWLAAARATLDRAVMIRRRDLDLEWCGRARR